MKHVQSTLSKKVNADSEVLKNDKQGHVWHVDLTKLATQRFLKQEKDSVI
jgi:hypothetical protein